MDVEKRSEKGGGGGIRSDGSIDMRIRIVIERQKMGCNERW